MWTRVALVTSLLLPLVMSSPFGHIFRQHKALYKPPLGDDPGEPLFLTPYIKKGDFATGEWVGTKLVSVVSLCDVAKSLAWNCELYSLGKG